jgi:6-pyruvoyltetrahydropterin/6-carboxytetrahydropterin synthase
MSFGISRRIEIDMGHRVPTHGSKCWNWHGHRYVIIAHCQGDILQDSGVQTDMVMDFGFLKDVMMKWIYNYCDHGMVVWSEDPWLRRMVVAEEYITAAKETIKHIALQGKPSWAFIPEERDMGQSKVLLVPFIPTAERLAEFWFALMQNDIRERSAGMAELIQVEVHETPNCHAMVP